MLFLTTNCIAFIMKKLFLLLVIILSNNAFGCSCAEKPSVKEDWTYSHDVYTAKITSVDSSHYTYSGNKLYLIDLKIIHHYKKLPNTGYEMRTFYFRSGGSCDFAFQIGKEYLIYETRSASPALSHASLCSRTGLLSSIKTEELNELQLLYNKSILAKDEKSDIISLISEKEFSNLKEQSRQREKLSYYNLCLIITSALLFLVSLVFIILYIKTKKKLKRS